MNEENLSILALILNAGVLVQAVMGILLIASVMSWIMIVQRGIFLNHAQISFREFEDTFWSGVDLAQFYQELTDKAKESGVSNGIENVFRAGFREFNRLTQSDKADPDAVMEGADRAMRVALSREDEKLGTNLPFSCECGISESLYWPVWHCMGNYGHGKRLGYDAAGNLSGGGSGDFRGAHTDSNGALCSHSCGYRLQPLCG